MRFSICCHRFLTEERGMIEGAPKRRGTFIDIQTGPPLTTQPGRSESIQLDVVPKPIKQQTHKNSCDASQAPQMRESLVTTISTIPVNELTTSASNQRFFGMIPSLSATSNFNYIAKNGTKTTMAFDQITSNFASGTYKGYKFTIVKGDLQLEEDTYTEQDKRRILKNYSQALMALQQGMLGIEADFLKSFQQQLPPLNPHYLQELTMAAGSEINVKFTTEVGENYQMIVKQIKPGLFQATLDGRVFTIVNGQVLTLDGADHGLNKELILSSFYRAMLGFQQTKLGLQKDDCAKEARLSEGQLNPMELLKAACPEKRAIFEVETLKVHNEFRKIHGVPPLVHSDSLSELARQWAEHLALKDTSYQRQNNEFGENLYYSHGGDLDARRVVTTWYDEINLYDFNDPELSKDTGHFMQLVWRSTKEIGTGIAQIGDKKWVCCYYHPRGNIGSSLIEEVVPPVKEATT